MYDKFLFVGLGGSGGKTLRFLKREILRWTEEHGAGQTVPQAWQFLHIDTPVNPDGDEVNHLVQSLDADEYLGLIAPGTELRDVQGVLDADKSIFPELRTWRVEPAATDVPVQQGAGQMRAIGQTVAMASVEQIRTKIEQHVTRMRGASAHAELAELYQSVTGARPASSSSMYIVLVSSLAGGTGAGLLNLVSNVLRALRTPAGDNIFAVLYTPEVFGTLGGAATAGVYPNSLAAVSELLNGHWWQGSEDSATEIASPRENAVLRRAGLPAPQARNGPKFPFLVGRVGAGGTDFGSPDRLFEMTARSLASWATPTAENSGFVQYTIGNWNTLAKDGRQQQGILVDDGESHEQGLPPMSALGFSRLSVGSSYLAEYATQRIAKDALRHLARYHSESDDAESVRVAADTDDPDVVLKELAKRALPAFLRHARLTELGPDHNEIQEDLAPESAADLKRQLEAESRDLADLQADEQRSSEQWAGHVRQSVSQAQDQYELKYRRDLEASTLSWVEKASSLAVEAVAESIATRGLAVTAELVSQTKDMLQGDIYDELLNSDAPRYRIWAADITTAVNDKLGNGIRKMRSDNKLIEDALMEAVYYAGYAGEAMVAEKAAYLARDLAQGVLSPLHRSLTSALELAEMDLAVTDTWVGWTDDRPPESVRPPVGDYPLLDPDDYPKLFSELTASDIGTLSREMDQRVELRRQIISGSFGAASTAGDKQSCVEVRKSWFPQAEAALGGSRSPSDMNAAILTGLDELKSRARRWLYREGSSWQQHLSMTIRQFVGSDDPDDPLRPDEATLRQRRSRFDAQFSAAVSAASPFISLDSGLMGPVHQSRADEPPNLSFSPIPLESHVMGSQVRTRLVENGVDDSNVTAVMNNDNSITRIDITGQLKAPVSPLVVESLMRPISERWGQAATANQRNKFWDWRRAQPLESFVPAPQALIRCMVRGWYTGQMLGLIATHNDSFKANSIVRKHVVEFPANLLTSPRSRTSGPRDNLASVLESLPLAYIEVSRTKSLDPLDAYIALRELGRSYPAGSLFSYPKLNDCLERWVMSGQVDISPQQPLSQPIIESHDAWSHEDAASDRAMRLAEFCKAALEQYQEEFDAHTSKCTLHPSELTRLPLWTGLWVRHLGPALQDIITAAEKHSSDVSTRPAPMM